MVDRTCKVFTRGILALIALGIVSGAMARSIDGRRADDGDGRYLVLFEAPPLATHMAAQRAQKLKSGIATSPRLDVNSPDARAVLGEMDSRFEQFRGEATARIGREFKTVHRYRYALNGFSAHLSATEARRLARMPGVARVEKDRAHRLHSDSGPQWIGADSIWSGQAGGLPSRGEGVVIGVIDSGINWDHPSFSDPGGGGAHDHVNPFGQQLGLCSKANVLCNDKLVGVYDFVEDDPETPETEEFADGFDNSNHGSLSASVAAGNPLTANFNGQQINPSGVAPNANIISLRVCYTDDPDDPDDDACQNSAIIKAIDQAIADGVDVINYSIGTDAFSPWDSPVAIAFLNASDAGIFVATSAGNEGPVESTIGSPGNAPWITAVGAASHDRLLTSVLDATQGGIGTPPGTLYGASLATDAVGPVAIVHARDFGNALCGAGPEELGETCDDNTGASNPFAPGTFNGQIVVCDRGTYGRIEKGKNVMLAGAGGYVLANTSEQGEDITPDEHCLASTHVGESDGDALRAWLDSGSGHLASISGFTIANLPELGDRLAAFSSRGPSLPPVEDLIKPNLVAPGMDILGAGNEDNSLFFANGTSFSSPHVAGAAALLKSVNGSLTPRQIASMLEMTALASQVVDENGDPATAHQRGAGRPRLDVAVNAGIYLDETTQNFLAADPASEGDPKSLNLPSMADNDCPNSCSFTRTLKPIVPGAQWNASAEGFPEGVVVTVTPDQFFLGNNGSQQIEVTVDLSGAGLLGQWVEGRVVLSAAGLPDALIRVMVFSTGGIDSDANGGWQDLTLSGLPALPQATFTSGGLVLPDENSQNLIEDPTWENPYDGGEGVFTQFYDVPAGALWLHARTLVSESEDVDLFVGRDDNGDGIAQANELECESRSPDDLEQCDIFKPQAGSWWILVQNWEDGFGNNGPAQEVTLLSAVVGGEKAPNLHATGPGITAAQQPFKLRLSWDNVNAVPGQRLLGAVGIGTKAATPNNVDVIPIVFDRTGIEAPATTPLYLDRPVRLALDAGQMHERMYIDVPPGATNLTVKVRGRGAAQTGFLDVAFQRVEFDDAFEDAPFVRPVSSFVIPLPPQHTFPDAGPVPVEGDLEFELTGNDLQPGRHYVLVENEGNNPASVTVRAEMEWDANPIPIHGGLYEPVSRPDIKQGFEYNGGANSRAVIWYTFGEDGEPTWFLSSGGLQDGNIWTSDLLRFTNDGQKQQPTVVGSVSLSLLSSLDVVFNWTLYGESGTERTKPISAHLCPEVNGTPQSYTGLWYPGFDGLGGSTVLVNASFQAQVHYLYDAIGIPRWLFSSGVWGPGELPLVQWKGFCPVCAGPISHQVVGVLGIGFDSETTGTTTLDYVLGAPLVGDIKRTDSTSKITSTLPCN